MQKQQQVEWYEFTPNGLLFCLLLMALTIQEYVTHNNLYSLIEKTSVQSHFEYFKLRINPDLEEVSDFRNRLVNIHNE
ncbi:hypothetical protein AHAS_Ahas12G0136700 [Arachis hypogaea]